ncbi:MAG: DUF3768 domain-containing protein [Paracoccaceae bacterium]|nr:DUF3768 domain-containing protein [Paracoccaceae bacterium]
MLDTRFPDERTGKIAAQNDAFRKALSVTECDGQKIDGTAVLTRTVMAMGAQFIADVTRAVRDFATFTDDNDPLAEHDFGVVEVCHAGLRQRAYWKIDLYDEDYVFGSPCPEDPAQTRRVLTIMLPEDY